MSIKIVAELSANHNHDFRVAAESIIAAKESGADAVKLQTYTADTLTINCNNKYFQLTQGTIWDGRTLYDLYQEAYTPWEWHAELFDFAEKVGIQLFSTPFDYTAVDFLDKLNCPIYKIASFEITDIPLIEYTAAKGKPMILSTGIASFTEIDEAVNACRKQGNHDITLLQCTSQYPARLADANLLMMQDMAQKFQVKMGLSDHSIGYEVAVVAAAMGATVIEKHFILDRTIGGPDAVFSMVPDEFKSLVRAVRNVESIRGKVDYSISGQKEKSRMLARSLFVVEDVQAGDVISNKNVRSIRPGYGLSPKHLRQILGFKFRNDIQRGTPLSWEMIDDGAEGEE